ncbi:MAG: hypothetical protein JW751_12135 [Polyangiaceae bacterium]|nr:hypothetical protein [Polyangiaceae bacterium]
MAPIPEAEIERSKAEVSVERLAESVIVASAKTAAQVCRHGAGSENDSRRSRILRSTRGFSLPRRVGGPVS